MIPYANVKGMKNKSVLVLSDQHFPYQHRDIIPFLKAIKLKYKPDRVINIGDEIDGHAISFHQSDPDLVSPGDELQNAICGLKSVYKLFPVVDVVESNHGSLVYRKGKVHGLPRFVFKSYKEILQAPKGWNWHFDLIIKLPNRQLCYFHHATSSSVLKASQSMGMNCVFGHHHNKFSVEYWNNGIESHWGMFVGCMVDLDSMAFAYGQNNLKKPVIGCGIILDGHPVLIPMKLDSKKRWTGVL